ncbi:MAG: hypothetical protein HC834_04665 [Rhodospirillales bacterium]|nr:hypothetical protein [Rhodospirillales bacterium]
MSASLARMIHLALMAARLVVAHVTGDDAAVLGRACSIRYSLAYMTAAARLAAHTVFGSTRADCLLRRLR